MLSHEIARLLLAAPNLAVVIPDDGHSVENLILGEPFLHECWDEDSDEQTEVILFAFPNTKDAGKPLQRHKA